jgi:hypothetical protein
VTFQRPEANAVSSVPKAGKLLAMRVLFLAGIVTALMGSRALAVENLVTLTYKESPPANTDIPNWTTGWVQPTGSTTTTGWDYVGSVGGNSAVYLGNGWVATAAHVGTGTFVLNNVAYPMVPNSTQTFGTTDLILFEVSPTPLLPALPIRTTNPVSYSSPVAIIGFGHTNGDRDLTWGYNTVTQQNEATPVTVGTVSYNSQDFWTFSGTTSNGSQSVTNDYGVVIGDSGGGAFIFNPTTQMWELAGINEVNGTVDVNPSNPKQPFSGFVQLNLLATQINKITAEPKTADTPTMPPWGLIALAGVLIGSASFHLWTEKS